MKKYIWVLIVVVAAVIVGVAVSRNKSPKTVINTTNTTNAPHVDQQIDLTDFAYTPNEFTAGASQTIKVLLNNKGQTAHSLTFDKLDFTSGLIDPGQSKTVTFTTPSKAGRYDFHSTGPNAKDKDMKGVMIVE